LLWHNFVYIDIVQNPTTMKPKAILLYLSLILSLYSYSQGSSCATAIPIPLDDICRDYTISASTGGNVVCISAGSSPITYFSVTSNSSADNILLNITGPNSSPVEVAMYINGSCTNGNLQDLSSMCLNDGNGLWAPAETFVVTPNTTYILRIKTSATGTIRICGKNYSPPNDDCLGATPIGPFLVNDNNACHKPGPGVVPGQLCASSLENTAFYTYMVETTGPTTLSIENATCDNGNGVNSVGFQVGFFTGSCTNLSYFQCYAGFGSNIQAVTGTLTAGTIIYVAIDGIGGSNCSYSLRAINSVLLSSSLKYFTAWKTPEGNLLKWVSLREYNNKSFEVQRSDDGVNYFSIGNVPALDNEGTEKKYEYFDAEATEHCFYRLKHINTNGKFTFSKIIEVNRSDMPRLNIKFNNPVSRMLNMTISSPLNSEAEILIHNMNGQVVFRDKMNCIKGINSYFRDFSFLPTGRYFITTVMNKTKDTQSLLKLK